MNKPANIFQFFKIKVKQLGFTLIILLAYSSLLAQYDPIYTNLTVNDGLAGNGTYHIFQDSKGYIWIATNNGVSLFDGYGFKNFDIQTGLLDNIVFEIYEDYKGRIWFIPFSGLLSYYEKGIIKHYPYNSKIRENMPSNSKGPVKLSFFVDSLDNIYLGVKSYGIMHISPEGIFRKIDGICSEGEVVLYDLNGDKILISNVENPTKNDFIITHQNETYRYKLSDVSNAIEPIYMYAVKLDNKHILTSVEESITLFRHGKKIWTNSKLSSIIWLGVNDEYIMASDIHGGFYYSPVDNLNVFSPNKIFGKFQITSAIKDKEGGYWLSTLNNGILYIPDIHIQSVTTANGLSNQSVKAVYAQDNKVYLGYQMGWIDMIEDGSVKKIGLLPNPQNASFVRSFLGDNETGKLWICSFGHLGYLKKNRFHLITHKHLIYPREIIKAKGSDTYWVATANGILKLQNDKVVYDSRDDGLQAMALAIAVDKNESVWFLTYNGLWKYSNKLFQYLGEEDPLLSITGSALYFNPMDETLWVGTNGAGIVIIDKNGKSSQITKNEGIVSNSINTFFSHKGKIWVGTRQGLSILTSRAGGYDIQNLTIKEGLASNDVISLFVTDSIAYVGTSGGLSIINTLKIAPNPFKPKVYITSVELNDSTYQWSAEGVKIPWESRYLRISYVGLAFRNMGKTLYRYRLLGLDSNWVYTPSTQCLYTVFKPGNYTFEVEAQSSSGIWGAPASLKIAVAPPFWQRIWFILLFTILMSSILYLIYYIRMAELKRRNELINNINLYKQQSLRQQMNPHFIFNTLNSIQYYILEKDVISSHKYLTKFARLMRFTLDNSLYATIPLRDELEALKLYLELEALRLQDKFTFNIDYQNNETILDVKIPTLMIQPFVENAIWHGIMLKPDKSGHIQITIRDMETSLLCTIEDNGIGREQARKMQESTNKAHRSRGFQITQQRIDLLNSMYGQKFNIQIVDLYSNNGNPMGTRVTINIPKVLES